MQVIPTYARFLPERMRPRLAAQFLDMGVSTLWDRVKNDPDCPQGYHEGRIRYFDTVDLQAYAARLKTRALDRAAA